MFEADASKTPQELLEQVRKAAIEAFNNKNPSFIGPPIAALLVRLSYDADATAAKNLRIQNNLIRLTAVILALTVAMLVLQAFQIWGK
jgi:hypothetical protein